MQYSVDSISNGIVVLVDDQERVTRISLASCRGDISAGDIVFMQDGFYQKDCSATQKQQQRIQMLTNKIKKKGN